MNSLTETVTELARALAGYGPAGALAFFSLFGLFAMAMIPTSILSFVAALVFGWKGAVFAWLTMMAVASLSFALARTLLSARVARAVDSRRRLRVVADFVDARSWRVVLLVRVSGLVPFGVQNYAFGAMRIGFVPFIAASAAGMLPSILLASSAGVAGHDALHGDTNVVRLTIIGAAALASLVLIAWTARELRDRLAATGDAA